MIDINLIRNNPELVKENIKKKFQDKKLPLVDEVISLDKELRNIKVKADNLRNERNTLSKEIGNFMRDKKIDEANKNKEKVTNINSELINLEEKEEKLAKEIEEKIAQQKK